MTACRLGKQKPEVRKRKFEGVVRQTMTERASTIITASVPYNGHTEKDATAFANSTR